MPQKSIATNVLYVAVTGLRDTYFVVSKVLHGRIKKEDTLAY